MSILVKLILLTFVSPILCEYFYSNGTKYYFSAPLRKNWFQAQRFCHANNMYLATLHNEEEYRILLDVIYGQFKPSMSDDHFWTCGTDLGENDLEFFWFESGHAALYTKWMAGFPIAKREGCILLHFGFNYKFHDCGCLEQNYFICQDSMFIPEVTNRKKNCSYI